MADKKQRLRKVLQSCRAALPTEQALIRSELIQTLALTLECYRRAPAVVLYAPVQNEVDTQLIRADALATGRRVFYPRIDLADRTLRLAEIDPSDSFAPGPFGIPEPKDDFTPDRGSGGCNPQAPEPANPSDSRPLPSLAIGGQVANPASGGSAGWGMDFSVPPVLFTPGLAFTATGRRLGRGGGFYDRLLGVASRHLVAVGLCYSFQLLAELPSQPWDADLDYVVTESTVHITPRAAQVPRDGWH